MNRKSNTNHFKNRSLCSWTPESSFSQPSMTIFENTSFFVERKRKKLEDIKAFRNRNILSQSTKFASKSLLKLPVITPEVGHSVTSPNKKNSIIQLKPSTFVHPYLREYENPFKCVSVLKKRITFKCIEKASK